MKILTVLITALFLLAGCATGPEKRSLLNQGDSNIGGNKRVRIYIHISSHAETADLSRDLFSGPVAQPASRNNAVISTVSIFMVLSYLGSYSQCMWESCSITSKSLPNVSRSLLAAVLLLPMEKYRVLKSRASP